MSFPEWSRPTRASQALACRGSMRTIPTIPEKHQAREAPYRELVQALTEDIETILIFD
jgi:hypothetical protein